MDRLPGLTTKILGRHLVHLPKVDSTNEYVKTKSETLTDLALVLADEQHHGKGRLGRVWASAPEHGLYCSVYLERMESEWLTQLPLVTALAVREGLFNLCNEAFDIKWSNDLLYGGKKICGILCESRISPGRISGVIGIGVNLTHGILDFARLGVVYASSLFLATNKQFSPPETAAAICNALEPMLFSLKEEGFGPLREEYKKHCVTLGREVVFTHAGRDVTGMAVDIAPDGGLVVEVGGDRMSVSAEVVHRDM